MAGTIAGSLIFDTKTDLTGFNRGADDVNKSAAKMEESFKQLGGAIVAAFSVNAIKNIGLSLIETTAELQAMDAQFDQIFKGAENQRAFAEINKQSEELGIHIDRLKKAFSSFGAQFKGSGMDAQKAMEATSKATALAADAAAFYDVSLENASASLASFLKGNFEAGEAIGISTSASQMSTRAVKEFGKSWDKLTEAEKRWLMLDKVDEVYKLNGAMGQSKRESDNWTNSVENLKMAWERFKEIVGADLLNNVTEIVKGLTSALGNLVVLMQENPETTKVFMDAIVSFLSALTTYLVVKNIAMALSGLTAAFAAFDIALASPATKIALVAGAILLLAQMFLKLDEAMGSMDTTSQIVLALEALVTVALAAALAMGILQTTMSPYGSAAIAIGVGIAAMVATMKIAEAKAKSMASSNSYSGRGLPRLAEGGVIPPNSEFLAILGDQKRGTNIEAPMSTIEQGLRNVLHEQGGSGSGNSTVILQIDGREFARVTAPYNAAEENRLGVRLTDR
jgi:hypothetical protein